MNKSMTTLLLITAIFFSSVIVAATPDEKKVAHSSTNKSNRSWQKLGEIKTNYEKGSASSSQVALDPAGNAIVVWSQYDKAISDSGQFVGYWASRYTPKNGWDEAVKISIDEYPSSIRILMDSAGNAVATWKDDEIWANTYTVNKGWGKPQKIKNSSILVLDPRFVMNSSGHGILIWDGHLNGIWVAHYDPEKGWGDSKNLYKKKTLFAEPRVAINESGNALVTWAGYIGKAMESPREIMTSHYSPKTGWSDAEKFKTENVSSITPTIDPSGNGHIIWNEKKQGKFNRRSSRYMLGKGWEKEQQISAIGSSQFTTNHLATDSSGNTVAVWSQKIKKCHCLWVNYFTEKEGWDAAQRIEKENGSGSIERLRLSGDASGNVIAIWQQDRNIWATHLSLQNKKGVTHKLNDQTGLGFSGYPISDISMTPAGNAIAVWGQPHNEIYVTKFREFK